MSRTIRRKTNDFSYHSWNTRGWKTAKENTANRWAGWFHTAYVTFEEMSDKERFENYRNQHLDSHIGFRNVPRHFRNRIERDLRAYNRQELHKCVRYDYDEMCIDRRRGAMRDWY